MSPVAPAAVTIAEGAPPAGTANPKVNSADPAALKADHGEDAKFLAGGHSLIPLMKFRLARPATLVDPSRQSGEDQ